MADLVRLLGCLLLVVALCACAARPKEPVSPPRWEFEREAIRLNLTADPLLHLYQGAPHTLLVCLYQLSDPYPFTRKTESREGLTELLRCERFDPSVTSFRRIIVQPGEKTSLLLDRTEGTRDLGIIAGYFSMMKEHMVRRYPIPVEVIEKTNMSRPQKVDLHLVFGSQQISPLPE